SETSSIPSVDTEQTEHVGLTPVRVTVSVVVPTTYFEDIWRKRNETAPGQTDRQPATADLTPIEEEERGRIQNAVFAQIPHATDAAASDLVSVTAFTPIPVPPAVGPTVPAKAITWLADSWPTLGMILLVIVSLAMLRSLVRGVEPPPEAAPRAAL